MKKLYNIRNDAEEAGCYGLVNGYARNLNTYELFSAETCTSNDGPFFCPSCLSNAVIRKCTDKRDHFAHIARQSPTSGKGESELHYTCKNEICNALALLMPDGKWETERSVVENRKLGTPTLRPDISGYINGKLVAIEVQASVLSIPNILKKMDAYTKWKINTLWIIPLTKSLGDLPFRPRLYERYLHSMYYGRIYYWIEGQGSELSTVHLGIAGRNLEYREWLEDGELKSGGGYFKPYKTIKTPVYGNKVNISKHFEAQLRDEFTPDNVRKTVPKCLIWKDVLPVWWNVDEEGKYTESYFEEIYADLRLPERTNRKPKPSIQPKIDKHAPFHSDVEAQWSIFFDAMGIKYEYEKDTFQLDGASFIPDFWLPQVNMWADVKPSRHSKEDTRNCQRLANITGKRCLLLEGPPDFRSYWGLAPEQEEDDDYYPDMDYLLISMYLHSENRFFCDTGHSRENPATDREYGFGDDYIAAVEKSHASIKRKSIT